MVQPFCWSTPLAQRYRENRHGFSDAFALPYLLCRNIGDTVTALPGEPTRHTEKALNPRPDFEPPIPRRNFQTGIWRETRSQKAGRVRSACAKTLSSRKG